MKVTTKFQQYSLLFFLFLTATWLQVENAADLSPNILSEQTTSTEVSDKLDNYLPLLDSDKITPEDLFGDINDIDFNERQYLFLILH